MTFAIFKLVGTVPDKIERPIYMGSLIVHDSKCYDAHYCHHSDYSRYHIFHRGN